MGKHFDDVLGHDDCWISWRNLEYPCAKDIEICVVGSNI
jgi:hypothetical protein